LRRKRGKSMSDENSLLKQREFIERLEEIKKLANQCILQIGSTPSKLKASRQSKQETKEATPAQLNFGSNARAFVKKHAKQLSGPEIFVSILAFTAKGKINKQISLAYIEKLWKGMTGLIGMNFNRAYPVRAKDNGWVDSTKRGFYTLAGGWKGIFTHE
jgi:hypothetical protein